MCAALQCMDELWATVHFTITAADPLIASSSILLYTVGLVLDPLSSTLVLKTLVRGEGVLFSVIGHGIWFVLAALHVRNGTCTHTRNCNLMSHW